jgi:hypothetical protein
MTTYTPDDLRDLPTLSTGQCCSLKLETETTDQFGTRSHRVWLCRVGGGVTIETLNHEGRWLVTDGDCYVQTASIPAQWELDVAEIRSDARLRRRGH